MTDSNGSPGPRRGIHFDPTINLGHILTGAMFLVATVTGYVSLTVRVDQNTKDIDRGIKSLEGKADKETVSKLDLEITRRLVEQRQYMDQTQVRTADDIRDMKNMMRDTFRDLDARIDKKADKPGR